MRVRVFLLPARNSVPLFLTLLASATYRLYSMNRILLVPGVRFMRRVFALVCVCVYKLD